MPVLEREGRWGVVMRDILGLARIAEWEIPLMGKPIPIEMQNKEPIKSRYQINKMGPINAPPLPEWAKEGVDPPSGRRMMYWK